MNLKVLREPYPFTYDVKKDFVSSFLFGMFVFLFLLIFQPFGLSQYKSDTKTIELAAYGVITFAVLFLNNYLFSIAFPNWYSKVKWTVGKNISYTLYIFFCIGLANLIYSNYQGFIRLNITSLLYYQGATLLVGVFPVTISTLIVYVSRLKKAIKEADQINLGLTTKTKENQEIIEIPSLNKSDNLRLNIYDLIAVKAIENYIEVYILNGETIERTIMRNTLKNIEKTLNSYQFITKCHRSYLVNLKTIKNVSGNAQGLTLHCGENNPIHVLVSRRFVKSIKQNITNDEK